MPNATDHYGTTVLTNAAESANNTETVVATLTGIVPRFAGLTIRLRGWVGLTTGAGTTASTLRIRRGSLAGALVQTGPADSQGVAASKVCEQTIEGQDSPGEGTFTYVLTQQGTADAAVTTYQQASLVADVS